MCKSITYIETRTHSKPHIIRLYLFSLKKKPLFSSSPIFISIILPSVWSLFFIGLKHFASILFAFGKNYRCGFLLPKKKPVLPFQLRMLLPVDSSS